MSSGDRRILLVSILAAFVAFLDLAVVNVALPAISRDLGGGLSGQQWIVDAYLITLGSLILIAGSLSDLFGRKRILSIGLAGFGIASILCALAPTVSLLIGARLLQGVAGALVVPSSLALIIAYLSGTEQAKAIGTWTAWTGIAFIVGPLLGGFLVDNANWRWVFAVNVLPILITLWLMQGLPPEPARARNAKVDIVGAVLCALGLGGSVFALIEQPKYGWGSSVILLPLIAGVLLFACFLIYERRAKSPMLPLTLFHNQNFSVGNGATLLIYGALSAGTFLITLFTQQVAGYTALAAGMALLPVTLMLFFFSAKVGGLSGRYGPRFFMAAGPIIAGLGFLLLLRVNEQAHYLAQLLPGVLVFSVGLTLTVTPLVSAILGEIDKQHAGIASAINNAVARVAGLLAVAAVGVLVASRFTVAVESDASFKTLSEPAQIALTEAKAKPLSVSLPESLDRDIPATKLVLARASVKAMHSGLFATAILLIGGGLVSAAGIRNPTKVKV